MLTEIMQMAERGQKTRIRSGRSSSLKSLHSPIRSPSERLFVIVIASLAARFSPLSADIYYMEMFGSGDPDPTESVDTKMHKIVVHAC